jgi:hypothetical protein
MVVFLVAQLKTSVSAELSDQVRSSASNPAADRPAA